MILFCNLNRNACHANKLLLLHSWNEWDAKNVSSILYRHSWLNEWDEHICVSVSVFLALGDLSPDSPTPLQGARGPPSASISQRAAAAAAAALLGYHVRSLLIRVRLYAPPCWAQSITQRSHCNCDLHWQFMLCANQTSWAAKAHRVNDWMLSAGSRHTGDKFLLRSQLKPAALINTPVSSLPDPPAASALTCPLFGWRAVSFGWTASSSCVCLLFFSFSFFFCVTTGRYSLSTLSHWWNKVRSPRWSMAVEEGQSLVNIQFVHRGGETLS